MGLLKLISFHFCWFPELSNCHTIWLLSHWGQKNDQHFTDITSEFSKTKFSILIKFNRNLFLRIQVTSRQHGFRRWFGPLVPKRCTISKVSANQRIKHMALNKWKLCPSSAKRGLPTDLWAWTRCQVSRSQIKLLYPTHTMVAGNYRRTYPYPWYLGLISIQTYTKTKPFILVVHVQAFPL